MELQRDLESQTAPGVAEHRAWRQRMRGVLAVWFPPAGRRRAVLGAALAMLGAAGLWADNLRLRQAQRPLPQVTLVAAARDLPAGHVLATADLVAKEIPAQWAHPQAVRADEQRLLVGRALTSGVRRDEVMLYGGVAEPASADRMAQWVRPGERAVALKVDDSAAVGYFVRPSDRVDVFLLTQRYGDHVVTPVLQNVAVLATGHAVAGMAAPERYDRIVVSVTPREAELLLLAEEVGRVRLLLRNAVDVDADAAFDVLSDRELFGGEVQRQVQQQRNERVVRVITGS